MYKCDGNGGVREVTTFISIQINDIPTTLMVAMETTVVAVVTMLVLEHVTVLPFIAAVMFTVKMEDRQYVKLKDGSMLEAVLGPHILAL